MRVDFGGDLFIGDKFWLCGPCKSLTAAATERRPVTIYPVPQEPRIASTDERRRMGERPGAPVASQPDLFTEAV